MNSLEKLLYLRGVALDYLDYSGNRIEVPLEVRLKVLETVGYNVSDDEAIQRAVFELDALPWTSWLKPFNTLSQGDTEFLEVRVHPDEKFNQFSWKITTETGELIRGQVVPGELPEFGEYYIEGLRYSGHRLALPNLPMGYHKVELSSGHRQVQAELVVVPQRCFELDSTNPTRPWGVNCQLYTLRSARNCGIGDFSDLRELIECCAASGMDLVGLNPLHAPQMAEADFASPYSPSDRRFINALYIDPERVQDFRESESIRGQFNSLANQQQLIQLRALPLVDYDGVLALKFMFFDLLFLHFRQYHLRVGSDRAQDFNNFVQRQAEPLQTFSQHESACSTLAIASAQDPVFHQYLQWLANHQLQECQNLALASGMSIGLIGDLAVGAVKGGAEVEGNAALFCNGATVGAPPDPFAEAGQNWNLPALDPIALRLDNYRHFIDLLRANMSCCGALRIDHVMGLMRLWWCLPGVAGGVYVYYPLGDLLAILRLESHRNQCIVIGEDMGVVPDDLRVKMTQTAIYSNKIFYFERSHDQQFTAPQEHQVDALLMVTNHDVSTLAGWWDGTDLRIRSNLDLLDTGLDLAEALRQRREDKGRVLTWLQALQLLPDSWATTTTGGEEKCFDIILCGAILVGNARSCSRMMSFQLDDLQLLQEPVNIPGTHKEYPNWRRKQMCETKALFEDPQIQTLLASIYQERKQ